MQDEGKRVVIMSYRVSGRSEKAACCAATRQKIVIKKQRFVE